jgi:hypothetical protein
MTRSRRLATHLNEILKDGPAGGAGLRYDQATTSNSDVVAAPYQVVDACSGSDDNVLSMPDALRALVVKACGPLRANNAGRTWHGSFDQRPCSVCDPSDGAGFLVGVLDGPGGLIRLSSRQQERLGAGD